MKNIRWSYHEICNNWILISTFMPCLKRFEMHFMRRDEQGQQHARAFCCDPARRPARELRLRSRL